MGETEFMRLEDAIHERRFKLVEVAYGDLAALLSERAVSVCQYGLPFDAVLFAVETSPIRQQLLCLFVHRIFAPLAAGGRVPVVDTALRVGTLFPWEGL